MKQWKEVDPSHKFSILTLDPNRKNKFATKEAKEARKRVLRKQTLSSWGTLIGIILAIFLIIKIISFIFQ